MKEKTKEIIFWFSFWIGLIVGAVLLIVGVVALQNWLDDPDYKTNTEICIEAGFDKVAYIEGSDFCKRIDLIDGELVRTYEYLDVVKEQIGYEGKE